MYVHKSRLKASISPYVGLLLLWVVEYHETFFVLQLYDDPDPTFTRGFDKRRPRRHPVNQTVHMNSKHGIAPSHSELHTFLRNVALLRSVMANAHIVAVLLSTSAVPCLYDSFIAIRTRRHSLIALHIKSLGSWRVGASSVFFCTCVFLRAQCFGVSLAIFR